MEKARQNNDFYELEYAINWLPKLDALKRLIRKTITQRQNAILPNPA
jgi:hypothetical protein